MNLKTKKVNKFLIAFLLMLFVGVNCFYYSGAWLNDKKSIGTVVMIGTIDIYIVGNSTLDGDTNEVLNDIGFELPQTVTGGDNIQQVFVVEADPDTINSFVRVKFEVYINDVLAEGAIDFTAGSEWNYNETSKFYERAEFLEIGTSVDFITEYTFTDLINDAPSGSSIDLLFTLEAQIKGDSVSADWGD